MIRASNAGLLRAKQNAANIKNGTVGIIGRNMPITPKAAETMPPVR